MFGKKNKAFVSNGVVNLGPLFIDVASVFYQSLSASGGTDDVSAVLEFDKQQRVISIKNPTLNGKPKLPNPNSLEVINKLTTQIYGLSEINHLKELAISVIGGHLNAIPTYSKTA